MDIKHNDQQDMMDKETKPKAVPIYEIWQSQYQHPYQQGQQKIKQWPVSGAFYHFNTLSGYPDI